ncbi:hypothetical protein [Xylanimonas sp. McL0601]|uniref:hypothetical protein n=1 Tax=Xylanimonas sp. McL0601 TaxID=3414739 RepID=UPI003CEC06D7
MTRDPKLVQALLACYPQGWRRRYSAEYAQLLRDLRVQRHPLLIVDSLRGAARARMDSEELLMSTTRSPMATAVWAAGIFAVAVIGFQKLAEDTAAGGLWGFLAVAAVVALLALAVAAAPAALALLHGEQPRVWGYVAVPVVGVAVWFGVLRVATAISDGHAVHSGANVFAFSLLALAGVAVIATTAWAATAVLRRVPADEPARLRAVALLVLTVAMAAATVLAFVFGLRVRAGDPSVFAGDFGLLATPFVPSWVATVVLLAVATGLAAGAGLRQLTLSRG